MNHKFPFPDSGLSFFKRPANTLLLLGLLLGSPPAHAAETQPAVSLKQVAEGFVSPLVLVPLEDGSGRLLIADQVGTVHVLVKDGTLSENLFLDLRSRMAKLNQGFDERGLLGVALHPKFNENGKFYVYYSAPLRQGGLPEWDHTSHVSEFKIASKSPLQADPASERVLLTIDQPYFNHNGGRIAFGPDGYLYIALGDGGNANGLGRGHSSIGNGQDLTTLLGKILRIDINVGPGASYAIPSDNPVLGVNARPEIFAYGFRNPWGMSFDRGGSHELFVSDVGQNRYEEINLLTKGGNYGWFLREGFECFDPKNPNTPPADCPKVGAYGEPLLDPVLAYKSFRAFPKDPESMGISVTGGYVYRGKTFPELQGRYLFADWSKNWAVADGALYVANRPRDGAGKWSMETLPIAAPGKRASGVYIVAIGQDADGEIYLLTNNSNSLLGQTGKVHKLVRP